MTSEAMRHVGVRKLMRDKYPKEVQDIVKGRTVPDEVWEAVGATDRRLCITMDTWRDDGGKANLKKFKSAYVAHLKKWKSQMEGRE